MLHLSLSNLDDCIDEVQRTQYGLSVNDVASIQFSFICIASITMQVVSRRFPETQIMTPE